MLFFHGIEEDDEEGADGAISGGLGDDAQHYQERDVRRALELVKEQL
ncbi:MAG: hypothetical protein ACXW3Z_13675 [Limisphaerales bacterium]